MTMPIALWEYTKNVSPKVAQDMADVCDTEFLALFRYANRCLKSDTPIACIQHENDHWMLYCNDPDIGRDTLENLAYSIREWKYSRFLDQGDTSLLDPHRKRE